MRDYIISKRLKELCGQNQSLSHDANMLLFKEYTNDKVKNIPLEQSEARTLLILGNKRIIYFVLKKEFAIYGDCEDLEEFAVGKIGLVYAVDGYNSERGIQFVTYAYRVIANQINKYYRSLNSSSNIIEKEKISLDDYICNSDDEDGRRINDLIKDDNDFVEQVVDSDMVANIQRNIIYLSYKEAFTIINFFGLFGKPSLTQIEIAKRIGVPQCSVSRHLSNGTRKLRVLTLDESLLHESDLKLKKNLLLQGPQNDLLTARGELLNM